MATDPTAREMGARMVLCSRRETQDSDIEKLITDGGWMVFAKDEQGWVHFWPVGQKLEGILKTREEAVCVAAHVFADAKRVAILRIDLDTEALKLLLTRKEG